MIYPLRDPYELKSFGNKFRSVKYLAAGDVLEIEPAEIQQVVINVQNLKKILFLPGEI